MRDVNVSRNMSQQERDIDQALHPLRLPGRQEAARLAALPGRAQAGAGLALVPQRNLPAVTGQRPPEA